MEPSSDARIPSEERAVSERRQIDLKSQFRHVFADRIANWVSCLSATRSNPLTRSVDERLRFSIGKLLVPKAAT